MRLVFIHGFGETKAVFDHIADQLPGEHVFVDLWQSLGEGKRPNLNVIDFCKELIKRHDIRESDIVIGHSLGGKISHHIKHLQNNRIIQIASWTDQQKVNFPVKSEKLLLWLARNGFLFNKASKKFLLKSYNRPETLPYYEEAFDRLIEAHKHCSVNQLRLLLAPISKEIVLKPDLRIHAKRDNIIRYPNESFVEVPGDHFCLLTHPEEVSDAIKSIL
ncbi:alpha/beta fold hydrolase [Ekhidna sp.]|uniref:alpha/beta fold hydrolase n=1 Tax=Ekhidna sp. TaxID=2608089 RepID=UPI003B508B98